jgi:hypothetical protein
VLDYIRVAALPISPHLDGPVIQLPLRPFDLVLPVDAGYYAVAPEETADTTKIALFRDWLARSVVKA